MIKRAIQIIFKARPLYFFCSKKQHVTSLTRELLNQYRSYKPYKNIRIIHNLTMSRYDPDLQGFDKTAKWRDDQIKIHNIINELSGELHNVPHEELNMLLEVLRERGYAYTNELAVFRALNKQSKLLFGRHFKIQLLGRTLAFLKGLRFPKLTINKMLEEVVQILEAGGKIQKNHKISLTNLLKITIVSLQEPYITIPIVKRLIGLILKENASTLASLCALYHVSVILQNSLNSKIEYQTVKTNVREILFNPYEQMEEKDNEGKKTEDEQNQQGEHKNQIKKKLTEISNSIVKMFMSSVDISKLQTAIVQSVKADIQPFSKESLIYVCDIPKLKPYVENYLQKNLESLTPVQLIYLAKRCKDIGFDKIQTYLNKLGDFMNPSEKAYVYIQANKHFHRPIKAKQILALIDEIQVIDYKTFVAMAHLTELLSKAEQGSIKEILEMIKLKMPKDSRDEQDSSDGK